MSHRTPSDLVARAAQTLASPLAFETDDAWTEAVLAAVIQATGADRSFVQWPGEDRFVSNTFSDEDVAEYPRFFPLLQEIGYFERVQRLGVATRRMAYGPHVERMQRTEYVQDYLPSVRGFDAMAVSVPPCGEATSSTPSVPVQLLVHMARPGLAFDDSHVETARRLQPAFAAGVAVRRHLDRARADLHGLIDASGGACAVFSMDGRLLHLSRALACVLDTEPDRSRLLDTIREVVSHARTTPIGIGAATYVGSRGRYALSASQALGLRPLLVVTVGAPAVPEPLPAPSDVSQRFGLTTRQAEVALLLAARRSSREIADALSISIHTARHHVEAVLGRLGAARGSVAGVLSAGASDARSRPPRP